MKKTKQALQDENEELRARLEEAEETLHAIRSGEVDALLVDGKDGKQIYTLTGADRTYRLLLESMSEGAVTLNPEGFIIYCNSFFARLLKTPLDKLTGAHLLDFVPQSERQKFISLLAECGRGEIMLQSADSSLVPVYLSVNMLPAEPGQQLTCVIVTDLSEQKRDEKLIAEGKLSQRIFEQTAEALIICDEKGEIIHASNAAHHLCGQNALHQPFDKMFALTLAHGKHFTIAQALRRQAIQSSDAGFLRKDGTTFDLILTSAQLLDETGMILGCIITLTDITMRRQAEEALRQASDRLEFACRSGGIGIWEFDIGNNRVIWDDQMFHLYGITPDMFSGTYEAWRKSLHPDDLQQTESEFQQTLRGEKDFDTEFRVVWPDGAIRTLRANARVQRDASGRPLSLIGTNYDITERKQAEKELRESEERFRVQANAMPQLAWIAQPDGYLTWYNDRWYEYTGTTPAQMEGWGWQSVHDPKTLPEVLALWKNSIATEEPFDMEFPLRGADGIFRQFLTRGYPLKNKEGRVEQWFGTNTDITDRKRTEEALRASEERLRLVLEASSMGTFEVNLASGEGMWNSVEFELLGLKPGDVPGNPATFFRYIHPDDLELVKARWAEASRIGELDVEFRIVRADGKERWLAGKGRFAFEGKDGGQAVRFLGVNFDITARKRVEEELLESEAVLKDIIETVADPLYVKDTEGRLTLVNPATAAIVGKPLEQIIGHADREFYDDPVTVEAIEEHDRRVMQSGTVHIFEETIPTPTGYHVMLNTKAPRRDSTGLVIGLVGVARDITDRKRMEEDLKKRTAELEAANRDLESFSYSVSHDLRSPLHAINGFTAMILKNQGAAFDEDTRSKFNVIRANTKKMGQLIEDLLNFSRIGRKAMHIVPLNMADLARDVWKDLQHSNPDRVMTLDRRDMPAAQADRSLIHEVYVNLIGNAVKFTKQCPAAHIEAGGYIDGTENVYYIRDNGAGFDMAYYEKLFGIFQRLHNAEEYGGTGIGLTIVQRIIHKHGGRVWADGKVGEGATFYFTLPGK